METNRRKFIETGIKLTLIGGLIGAGSLIACRDDKKKKEEGEEQEVSPPEDLMQEHGLLNRILLIYDTGRTRLVSKEDFPVNTLASTANIVRIFIEDYHEQQEENFIFPRFEKAGQHTGLVRILRQQHEAGRHITDRIMHLANSQYPTDNETQDLIRLLGYFCNMYRPHEAREDTVLFPAFRKLVSRHEYDSIGEDFERNEHMLFGADGFATMVDKVASLEKALGIYDLAQFTPPADLPAG